MLRCCKIVFCQLLLLLGAITFFRHHQGYALPERTGAEGRCGIIKTNPESQTIEEVTGTHREPRYRRDAVTPSPSAANEDDEPPRHHFVEVAVFVDEPTAAHHGEGLERFFTAVMSGANLLYQRRPGLERYPLHLSLIRVEVIRDDDTRLRFGARTEPDYRSFCAWQTRKNPPNDRHPRHHDLALLYTTQPIQLNMVQVEGIAPVGKICSVGGACAVLTSSTVLSKLITITAHEIGHLLNMVHDDEEWCTARFDYQPNKLMNSFMYSYFSQISTKHPWSTCSANRWRQLVEGGNAECLRDVPQHPITFPRLYPGEMINATEMCQIIGGPGAIDCPPNHRMYFTYCKAVQCLLPGEQDCVTHRYDRPDGSACGGDGESHRRRMCWGGECTTRRHRPRRVDGHWSDWSRWGECSRTCDGGVMVATRTCTNPPPQNGGRVCRGKAERYRICERQNCDGKLGRMADSRLPQCNQYFRAKIYAFFFGTSTPFYLPQHHYTHRDVSDDEVDVIAARQRRCELWCRSDPEDSFSFFQYKVADGTRCTSDASDVCVDGDCVQVGCNDEVNGSHEYNRCGTCDSDESACRRFGGQTASLPAAPAFSPVLNRTVPAGVGDVTVMLTTSSGTLRHSLVLRDPGAVKKAPVVANLTEAFILPRITYADGSITLERTNRSQFVRIPWRLNRELLLQVVALSSSSHDNATLDDYDVTFKWTYWQSTGDREREPTYGDDSAMMNDVITVSANHMQQQEENFERHFPSSSGHDVSAEEELMIMRASQSKSGGPMEVFRAGGGEAGEGARTIRSRGSRIPDECKSKCDLSRCKRTNARCTERLRRKKERKCNRCKQLHGNNDA